MIHQDINRKIEEVQSDIKMINNKLEYMNRIISLLNNQKDNSVLLDVKIESLREEILLAKNELIIEKNNLTHLLMDLFLKTNKVR